jgi:hypothetical protein
MSQLRQNKNEGVWQVTDEVVYEHENNHVGQVLIRFFFTVILKKSKITLLIQRANVMTFFTFEVC